MGPANNLILWFQCPKLDRIPSQALSKWPFPELLLLQPQQRCCEEESKGELNCLLRVRNSTCKLGNSPLGSPIPGQPSMPHTSPQGAIALPLLLTHSGHCSALPTAELGLQGVHSAAALCSVELPAAQPHHAQHPHTCALLASQYGKLSEHKDHLQCCSGCTSQEPAILQQHTTELTKRYLKN